MYLLTYLFQEKLKKVPGFKPNQVNACVKKDSPKVVDMVDMEDLGDKVRYAIPLRSSKKANLIFKERDCKWNCRMFLIKHYFRGCFADVGPAKNFRTAMVVMLNIMS